MAKSVNEGKNSSQAVGYIRSLYFQVLSDNQLIIFAAPQEIEIIEKELQKRGIKIKVIAKCLSPCG